MSLFFKLSWNAISTLESFQLLFLSLISTSRQPFASEMGVSVCLLYIVHTDRLIMYIPYLTHFSYCLAHLSPESVSSLVNGQHFACLDANTPSSYTLGYSRTLTWPGWSEPRTQLSWLLLHTVRHRVRCQGMIASKMVYLADLRV